MLDDHLKEHGESHWGVFEKFDNEFYKLLDHCASPIFEAAADSYAAANGS